MKESSASAMIARIGQILEDSLTPAGIDQWLRSRNRMWGGRRPVELIQEGDAAWPEEASPGVRRWCVRLIRRTTPTGPIDRGGA